MLDAAPVGPVDGRLGPPDSDPPYGGAGTETLSLLAEDTRIFTVH